MNKLIEYVKNTKNKTLKDYPFNEIDAACLSMISYVDLRAVLKKPMSLIDTYRALNKKFVLKVPDKLVKKNKELFKYMASSNRFRNCIIQDYTKIVDEETQFAAMTIIAPHQFKFIAFEGTDDLLVGWEEDFKMFYEFPVKAQKLAVKYLNKHINFYDILVYVGGHSKGGNLAIAGSINTKWQNKLRIKYIFNFDGPGFFPNVVNSKKYNNIASKIRNYYPEESVIGMAMENKGVKKIIKTNVGRVNSHDIHYWKTDNDKFKYSVLKDSSISFKKKLDYFNNNYTPEQRKIFVDRIFNILKKSGYSKKSELKKLNLAKIKNIIKETRNLKEDEKSIIIEVFKLLIKLEDREND